MPVYSADLLRATAVAAVRGVVGTCLEDAIHARARLGTADEEAMHDFRVAVRRVRSHLRAFARCFEPVELSAVRQALKEVQVATNPSRDLEVQRAWILQRQSRLGSARARAQCERLVVRMRRGELRATRAARAHIDRAFPTLALCLRTLATASPRRRSVSFAKLMSELVPEHGRSLGRRVLRVMTVEDVARAHAARIAAKRLRYLVEPLAPALPMAAPIVRSLKALQDTLGELHDVQLVAARLAAMRPRTREERRLFALLDTKARSHAARLFLPFRRGWREGRRLERFLARVCAVGEAVSLVS